MLRIGHLCPPPPRGRRVSSPTSDRRPSLHPLPLLPLPAEVVGQIPGDAGGGDLPFPAPWRVGRGLPCPWWRCYSGGSGPARPGGGRAVASRGGVAWRSARTEVAGGGSLPKIWATQALDGLERALDGLRWAGFAEFLVLPRGGDDDSLVEKEASIRHL
jgi:hypothetical protein